MPAYHSPYETRRLRGTSGAAGHWGRRTCRTAGIPEAGSDAALSREAQKGGPSGVPGGGHTAHLTVAHLPGHTCCRGTGCCSDAFVSAGRRLLLVDSHACLLPKAGGFSVWGSFSQGQCPGEEAPGGSRDVYITAARQPGGADFLQKEEGVQSPSQTPPQLTDSGLCTAHLPAV